MVIDVKRAKCHLIYDKKLTFFPKNGTAFISTSSSVIVAVSDLPCLKNFTGILVFFEPRNNCVASSL